MPRETKRGLLIAKTLGSARHKALVSMLIAKREEAGLTQTELAKGLGKYQSFLARLESGASGASALN